MKDVKPSINIVYNYLEGFDRMESIHIEDASQEVKAVLKLKA